MLIILREKEKLKGSHSFNDNTRPATAILDKDTQPISVKYLFGIQFSDIVSYNDSVTQDKIEARVSFLMQYGEGR